MEITPPTLNIGSFSIHSTSPVLLIAELSANHGQSLQVAKDTLYAAKESGADGVKFQTYTADTLTLKSDKSYFRINSGSVWDGKTLHDLYQEAYTPWEWHEELFTYAKSLGLLCFSSPFDNTAIDFLESLETPAYKIASFEIHDTELIRYAASKQKPVILSTGIAKHEDILRAMEAIRSVGNNQIMLLKCTSSYPCDPKDMNVSALIKTFPNYGIWTGLSDHSLSNTAAILSVAFGARLIEKHFILDPSIGGPDSSFSLSPHQFKSLVHDVREAEDMLGNGKLELSEKTQKMAKFSRSLFVTKAVKAGDLITPDNVKSVRPGDGLPAFEWSNVMGKTFVKDIAANEPLDRSMYI